MAQCGMCGNTMSSAEGCIEHKVLLMDGRVIDSPRHELSGSESTEEPTERCHDCGAEPGGIHHESCDWAQAPDGRQVFSHSMVYWDPETDMDPRDAESPWAFIVVYIDESIETRGQSPYHHLAAFDTPEMAEVFIEEDDYWSDNDDTRLAIKTLKVESSV